MENFYHFTKNGKNLYILIMEDENIKGFIYFNQVFKGKWQSSTAATIIRGYGEKLHMMGLSVIHPNWFIPYREKNIRPKIQELYKSFLNREDIIKEKINKEDEDCVPVLNENDDWFNTRYKLKTPNTYEFLEDKKGWIKHEGLKFFNTLYDLEIKNEDI
jgi:hypothetical protein